jgi:hypothetical protein
MDDTDGQTDRIPVAQPRSAAAGSRALAGRIGDLGVRFLGASSDHLVVDVTEADPLVRLGDELTFRLLYGAVATGMASSAATQIMHPLAQDRDH